MNSTSMPPVWSVAHQHIVAVVNTLLSAPDGATVRVLDLGCGSGRMLHYMAQAFALLRPSLNFAWHGLDIGDTQPTIAYLEEQLPATPWRERILTLEPAQSWPWPAGWFDVIVSNQVLEHIMFPDAAFANMRRCLSPAGFAAHLFPLRETIIEPHAYMPLVHRITDERARARWIGFFTRIGLRKSYRIEAPRRGLDSIDAFARTFAHVLTTDTNYLSAAAFARMAAAHGLTTSYAYTPRYLAAMALSFARRRSYIYAEPGLASAAGFHLAKRISSTTAVLRIG